MYRPVAVGAKLKLTLTNPKRTFDVDCEVRTCTEVFPQASMRAYRVGCKFIGAGNEVRNQLWTLASVECVNDHYQRLKDRRAYRFGYHRFPCVFEFDNGTGKTSSSAIVENMDLDSLSFNTQCDLDIFQNLGIEVHSAIGDLKINGSISKKELKEESSGLPHFEYEVKIESFDHQSRSLLASLTNSRMKNAELVSKPVPNRLREPIAAPAAVTSLLALAASVACLVWCWNIWGANYKVGVIARNGSISKSETDQVNNLFDRVIENGPTITELPFLVNAKRTFETAGDFSRLNQASAAILLLQPENDGLTLYRANLLAEQGDLQEASALYEKLLSKEAVSSDLTLDMRLGAARCFVRTKDWDAAIENFEVALNIDPGNSDIVAELAWVFINLDQLEKAIELFEELPEQHPDKDALYVQIEMKNGNFETAQARLLIMLSESPGDDSLEELIGDCYLSNGAYALAKESYLGITSVEGNPKLVSKLGTTFFLLADYQEAVNMLANSEVLNPGSVGSEKEWRHFLLSAQNLESLPKIAMLKISEFEGRIVDGEEVSYETLVELAEVVAKHGDPSRAIDYFRRSVDQQPQHPRNREWRRRLAELLQGEQRYKEADIEYQRLLTTRENSKGQKFGVQSFKNDSALKTSF
ncbi:MAG: tetratricopeptide repeat protein, partial [Planctomycetota bacterium]|nr:tetratricopeptide repeat protein [Planctomycetota bacterium]